MMIDYVFVQQLQLTGLRAMHSSINFHIARMYTDWSVYLLRIIMFSGERDLRCPCIVRRVTDALASHYPKHIDTGMQ
jgi:hypothetical protein